MGELRRHQKSNTADHERCHQSESRMQVMSSVPSVQLLLMLCEQLATSPEYTRCAARRAMLSASLVIDSCAQRSRYVTNSLESNLYETRGLVLDRVHNSRRPLDRLQYVLVLYGPEIFTFDLLT